MAIGRFTETEESVPRLQVECNLSLRLGISFSLGFPAKLLHLKINKVMLLLTACYSLD
jgi:hypothetical protein